MRVSEDVRRIVAFIGIHDDTQGKGGIHCGGTGFFVYYDNFGYFVTSRHIAHDLRDISYLVRVNVRDGTSVNIEADGLEWFDHPDPNVDVSIAGFWIPKTAGLEMTYLHERFILSGSDLPDEIGIGDLAYTVGLFRLLSGEKRNLPVVHSGSIALLPGDEKIPVKDWREHGKTIKVEGYLVEATGLQGLSGSPVFVRRSVDVKIENDPSINQPAELSIRAAESQMFLLGIWQGAWDAPPDEVMALEVGQQVRVPVGFGIVVPATKIVEVLELPDVKARRARIKKELEAEAHDSAASLDASPVFKSKKAGDAPKAADRSAFNRLLGAAVKPPKSSDQT